MTLHDVHNVSLSDSIVKGMTIIALAFVTSVDASQIVDTLSFLHQAGEKIHQPAWTCHTAMQI